MGISEYATAEERCARFHPAPEPVVEVPAPEPVVEAPAPAPVVEAPAPAPEPEVDDDEVPALVDDDEDVPVSRSAALIEESLNATLKK
jgi:hypothetical protein